jgi:hypothetical protein
MIRISQGAREALEIAKDGIDSACPWKFYSGVPLSLLSIAKQVL